MINKGIYCFYEFLYLYISQHIILIIHASKYSLLFGFQDLFHTFLHNTTTFNTCYNTAVHRLITHISVQLYLKTTAACHAYASCFGN